MHENNNDRGSEGVCPASEARASDPNLSSTRDKHKPLEPVKLLDRLSASQILLFLAGVVLPAATIVAESYFHLCAGMFFNPIPSWWHTALTLVVPAANLCLWVSWVFGIFKDSRIIGPLAGLAIGVAGIYSVLMAPIMPFVPFAVMSVVFGLFALLAVSPMCSLIAAVICWRRVRQRFPDNAFTRSPVLAMGAVSALCVLTAIELPSTLTRIGMTMASRQESAIQGVRFLRHSGDRDIMLRMCYERSGRATDILGFLYSLNTYISTDEARSIYYKVTGAPFNSVPVPHLSGTGRWGWDPTDVFAFDQDVGGDAVGGIARGLALRSSELKGSIDVDAALSYCEWILVFSNGSNRQQEARCQIMLPTGSVVSRATLWVNGIGREAVFAKREAVRAAYQRHVFARRDPLLVTSCGPDRVLVQCFPVQPGNTMKIRIGITSPLMVPSLSRAELPLPYFTDRNFAVAARHQIHFECRRPLAASPLFKSAHRNPSVYSVDGEVSNSMLSQLPPIQGYRSPDLVRVVARDAKSGTDAAVEKCFLQDPSKMPEHVFLVVDGSVSMKDHLPAVAKAIQVLPDSTQISLRYCADQVDTVSGAPGKISDYLYRCECIGGHDNSDAVLAALRDSCRHEYAAVLWVHGPQPVQGTFVTHAFFPRAKVGCLYDFQVAPGPNRLLERSDVAYNVVTVARLGDAKTSLTRFLSTWHDACRPVKTELLPVKWAENVSSCTPETSAHLARLYAYARVLEKLRTDNMYDPVRVIDEVVAHRREAAIRLAATYHLVTPVSGAVVLETNQQYRDAGLMPPGDASAVPTVPEPEEWLLLAVTLAVISWCAARRRLREARA